MALLAWPARRWLFALVIGLATYLLLGLPTVVVSNSIFGREIEITNWSVPVLVITSILSGLLAATYFQSQIYTSTSEVKLGSFGSFFSFLAIGCPVCNKIALLALGYSGAIKYFAPLQPYLAALGIGLLLYALRKRILNEYSCQLPNN